MNESNLSNISAINLMAQAFNAPLDFLTSKLQNTSYVLIRTAICHLLRVELGVMPKQISRETGWETATIRCAVKRHPLYMKQFEEEYSIRYQKGITAILEARNGYSVSPLNESFDLDNESKILFRVSKEFGVTNDQLQSKSLKCTVLSRARAAYAYLLKHKLGMSVYDISTRLNRAISPVRQIMEDHPIFYKMDNEYKMIYDRIVQESDYECILVVEERLRPEETKVKKYGRKLMNRRVILKMFNQLIANGMITTECKIDKDGDNIYTSRLNVPKRFAR